MKYVEGVYVDARDGYPATKARPTRNGPAYPHPQLTITAVDHQRRPSRIYGTVPDDAEVDGEALWVIDQSEHNDAVEHIQKRRQSGRLRHLARARYERETSGVDVDGRPLHTDHESQGKLAGARAKAKEGRAPSTWKLRGGGWWDIGSADSFVAVADEVFNYIDACFAHERALAGQLMNDERPELEEGWPARNRSTS